MAFFKIKVDGKVYELDRLTLGDARVLKRDFGLTDLESFSTTDPDQMVGLMALAISKTDGITIGAATVLAEQIDIEQFEPQDPDEPSTDPTQVGDDSAEAGASQKPGNSGKRQKKPGRQS